MRYKIGLLFGTIIYLLLVSYTCMNESQTCYLTLHPTIINGGSAIELELITQL